MTHGIDASKRWLALIVLCLGVLMIVLDTTIVNVALPSIREDLHFSETSLVWVVNAYMLTFGGFLLLGGRLGDLYGHRRMFLLGLTLFTLASLGLRPCQLAEAADRRARGAGSGRRGGFGDRAVADHESVHRSRRAGEGHGHLRFRLRRRRQHRRAARRRAHERAQLALDIPGQSADRDRGLRRLRAASAEARRKRARRASGRRGRGHGDDLPDARDLRDRQWQRSRLDLAQTLSLLAAQSLLLAIFLSSKHASRAR